MKVANKLFHYTGIGVVRFEQTIRKTKQRFAVRTVEMLAEGIGIVRRKALTAERAATERAGTAGVFCERRTTAVGAGSWIAHDQFRIGFRVHGYLKIDWQRTGRRTPHATARR
jgi:hypothetical protein